MMWVVSAISLWIIITCCTAGIYAPTGMFYLSEKFGMVGVSLFSIARLQMIAKTLTLSSMCMPAEAQVFGHVGLATYCLGRVYRYWRTWVRHERARVGVM